MFEKLLSKQVTTNIDKYLSKYQCRFRKGYSAQNCLLAILEKRKQTVDNGQAFETLSADPSKAFDYLPHLLLISK